MASKQCPKCGEDNPAEAVMCWACYTPLSGAAGAGANGAASKTGGQPGAPVIEEAPAKKSVDPKTIVVAALLLVGIAVAFLANSGGSKPPEEDPATNAAPQEAPAATAPPASVAAPPLPPLLPMPAGPPPVPPPDVPIRFTLITQPNARYFNCTMGILVSPTLSPLQAASAAKAAKNQLTRNNGRWNRFQIVVFADKPTAKLFKAYQRPRRGLPLGDADYRQLAVQGVWANCPVFLEAGGKKENFHYPSRNANSWWLGR